MNENNIRNIIKEEIESYEILFIMKKTDKQRLLEVMVYVNPELKESFNVSEKIENFVYNNTISFEDNMKNYVDIGNQRIDAIYTKYGYGDEYYKIQDEIDDGGIKLGNFLRKVGKTFYVDTINNIYDGDIQYPQNMELVFTKDDFLPSKKNVIILNKESNIDKINPNKENPDTIERYRIDIDDNNDVVFVGVKNVNDYIVGENLILQSDGLYYQNRLVLPKSKFPIVGSTVGLAYRPSSSPVLGNDGHTYDFSYYHDGQIIQVKRNK